jgi:hypothetical protein
MFNNLDDKEDSYYLKYVYCPSKNVYGYVGKSLFTNNYQYCESDIEKHIQLYFSKGRVYNEDVVDRLYKKLQSIKSKM